MPQFRTKARAVELLGKGQIADLPTAISELWKNGYDAYGDDLQASLYMPEYQGYSDPVFVLSDDGRGMDGEDILEKWFVLGTDSKTRGEIDKKGPDTLDKKPRVKMGEKGIGRLAVAYLGPQMLMISKKKNHPLQMVFFDWRILENYDLFLSDINIPLRAITSLRQLQSAFKELKDDFLGNFPPIKLNQKDPWRDQNVLKKTIVDDCNKLKLPDYIVDDVFADLVQDATGSHSTRFVIFQPDQQILQLRNFTKNDENEDFADDTSVNYTVSTLAGLFNLFKTEEPEHQTSFWIYDKGETGRYDLLSHKQFFTPKDFEDCDHLIEGKFSEEGTFDGTVRIYNKVVPHKFQPQRKKGKTQYGPFNIKIGYVQQVMEDTRLNEEQKRVFEEKLTLYSGLYIYRDGFRVLPYGRPDTDFLEFEERRSRHAGTYFFSKRRMFGYIEITRSQNEQLKDKSSREGFINNVAYRDFKVDLIAFFKDLAKKYFGTKAESTLKSEQQEELKEKAEAEKQEHERDKEARKEFAANLTRLPKELLTLQTLYSNLLQELQEKSGQAELAYDDIKDLITKIDECKVMLAKNKMAKPSRFKPTPLQAKKFHAYNKQYKGVVEEFDSSVELLRKVRSKLKVHDLFKEFEDRGAFYQNTLWSFFRNQQSELQAVFDNIRDQFNVERRRFLEDFNDKFKTILPPRTDATEITRSMKVLESIFNDSQERMMNRITPYLNHLRRLSFDVKEDELVGFYKEQFEQMKEEWNKTYELAQLGIAVEIIDHQFNALYSQLAESIKTINNHLQPNKDAGKVYRNLSNAFEHLQDNYKLLQPLYRTTGRIRKDITGLELKEYAEEFFGERLQGNEIRFTITAAGKSWKVYSYESIFKPVLINIINNAVYWLQQVDNREIKIDADGEKLLVMNSGAPIDDYLLEDIFKLFHSERPKGRGIGLYLAKQSLNGIGFEIEATNDAQFNKLKGACFMVYPSKSN